MGRSKSDISNSAIRIFLQDVGRFYDEIRGFSPYRSTRQQKAEVLAFFSSQCCYCGRQLALAEMSEDHLVPMNKESLGLHAWGNVVAACSLCNNAKHSRPWESYLLLACGDDEELVRNRADVIKEFVSRYGYEPNLQLNSIASNLYEDVGAVAMTLIQLRLQQAEAVIRQIHTRTRSRPLNDNS